MSRSHNYRDHEWEEVTVDPKGAGHTYRLEVPGGFIYRTVTYRFPEAHLAFETVGELRDYHPKGRRDTKDYRQWCKDGQEIVAQTTVFVPVAPLEYDLQYQSPLLTSIREGRRVEYVR